MLPREKAGFTGMDGLRRVAKIVRHSPAYLARCERIGSFPYVLGQRLSKLYNCPLDVFVIQSKAKGSETSACAKNQSLTRH